MKPCPFCGATDIRHHASSHIGRRFKCMNCHAEGPPSSLTIRGAGAYATDDLRMKAAAHLWNERLKPITEDAA